MKNKFLKLAVYCNRFGFLKGTLIILKIFFSGKNKVISLKVPGYKHPVYLRTNSSDEYIFQQIFVQQEYEIQIDYTPQTIIDAGGNIGFAAIWFANKYPQAKILCLEPEKNNFDLLTRNVAFYKNIIPIQKGLWNKSAWLEIIDSGLNNWGFTVKESSQSIPGAIEATSVIDLAKEYQLDKLDIVKIDIEGSEKEVLESPDVHLWLSKCSTLIIELHDRMKSGTSKALLNALSPYTIVMDLNGENIICHFPTE